ncbi:MAG TPA: alpha/beta fold hydrolase, partial [Candidatus Paceibacterota bacterium]|nr:alpha/beta fold hydrolase [Candidatus Paceibacterota bacterium]
MRDWYMVETFPLETERSLGGKIYFSDKPESNKVLIFGYGLGKNFSQNIEGFRLFANALRCWHGITVVTFDYRGTCASKMKFEKSSLLTRFEDFCSVVEYVRVLFPLKNWQIFLGGHSAGGPLAIRVADHFRDISGIILTAPAAYHNDAWKMRFGKAFTKVLARKHGWRYSLEFETLEELHKPTGLVVCEGDRVVWKA